MNHSSVSATRCDSCHNGSYTAKAPRARRARRPSRSRRARRTRLHHLPRQRGRQLHQLGRRKLHPSAHRHELLLLPQRHQRVGIDTPPHVPVTRRPVRQLPHQHGDQLRHLHDEPLVGERQPLRQLPQRLVHGGRHQRRAGHRVLCRSRRDQRARLHHLPRQRGHELHQLGRRPFTPISRATPIAPAVTTARQRPATPRRRTFRSPASSAATATPTRRRASSPTR